MELAIKYYKFIKNYVEAFDINIPIENQKSKSKDIEHIIKKIVNDLYINESILYFLNMSEDEAIKIINNKLKSETGTIDLLNKIETFIDEQNNYLTDLEIIYYNSSENINGFTNKVKLEYKNNKEFHKKNYYSLFIEYINIHEKLKKLL